MKVPEHLKEVRKPRVYFKWYPKLRRGFWSVKPYSVPYRKRTSHEQRLIDAAYEWTRVMNRHIEAGHEYTGRWTNGLTPGPDLIYLGNGIVGRYRHDSHTKA